MTIAEKILAAKSGKSAVSPGEIVDAYPDLVMSHTATWRSASVMQRVGAHDPATIAGAALLLMAVAIVAGLLPALRAARVDPMIALRYE